MASQPPTTKATPVEKAVADVAETIQAGTLPSTEQITRVLGRTGDLVEAKKEEAPLDWKGKQIAEQLTTVIQDTHQWMAEKQPAEHLQSMIGAATAATQELGQEAKKEVKGFAKTATSEDIAQEARAALAALRNFGTELVSSREFRGILVESIGLLQECLQLAVEKAQEGLKAAPEKIQEATGRVQEGLQEGAQTIEAFPEEPQYAEEKLQKKGKEFVEEAQEKGKEFMEQAREKGKEFVEEAQEKGKEAMAELRQGQVPHVLPLSEEQRERIRRRVDNLLRRIGNDPNYKKAFNSLWTLLEHIRQLTPLAKQRQEKFVEDLQRNENLNRFWSEFSSLIRDFAGGHSLDPLKAQLEGFFELLQEDERFAQFWRDLRGYCDEIMANPSVALTEDQTTRLNTLIDRAREITTDDRYRKALEELWGEVLSLLDDIKSDPLTNKLMNDLQQLISTLLLDSHGNLQFKPEELRQFKILLTSLLLEELKYVPIHRFQGSSDEYDVIVQNAHFYAADLVPEHIQVSFESNLDFNLPQASADTARTSLKVHITNIRTHMRNVLFWFRKKRGLIRMEDAGIANIDFAGDGASLLVNLVWDMDRRPSGFSVKQVTLDIDKFRYHVVESRHDWFLNLFSPILSHGIKNAIEREVQNNIRFRLESALIRLHEVVEQSASKVAEVAKEEVKDLQATKTALETAPRSEFA